MPVTLPAMDDEIRDDTAALGLVLELGALTKAELATGLDWPGWRTADALGRLRRAGLVRDRSTVTPTIAARRALELAL